MHCTCKLFQYVGACFLFAVFLFMLLCLQLFCSKEEVICDLWLEAKPILFSASILWLGPKPFFRASIGLVA